MAGNDNRFVVLSALGPRAGQPVRRLRSAAAAAESPPRCARLEGFSLHADVALPAHRRDRLEHLCRSLRRPPRALDRLTEPSGGQLLDAVRRPWAEGSIAVRLTPLEWLERLAGLVPAPRVQLLPSHGVLAPHAAWRAAIVPTPVVGAPAAEPGRADPERPRPPGRRSGAALLRRVFALEGLTCPRWGGPRRVVAAVTEPPALPRLLAALGLAAEPPPRPPVTVGPGPSAASLAQPSRPGRRSGLRCFELPSMKRPPVSSDTCFCSVPLLPPSHVSGPRRL